MPVIKGQPHPRAGETLPAETLTTEEVARLLAQCSLRAPTGVRNRALIMLLYRSGLRVSEVLALRPANVSFASHEARVLHGKGDKATTRGFHPSADDALARWLDARKALAAGGGWKNGPLFCTLDGAPLSDRYVRDMLKRIAGKAGVDKRVHPHGLRHTYAAELERSGMRLLQISRLLGHSSVAVTDRYLRSLTNGEAIAALLAAELPELPDVAPAPRKRRAAASHAEPQPAAPVSEARSVVPEPAGAVLEPQEPAPAPEREQLARQAAARTLLAPQPASAAPCAHPASARDWDTGRCTACGQDAD